MQYSECLCASAVWSICVEYDVSSHTHTHRSSNLREKSSNLIIICSSVSVCYNYLNKYYHRCYDFSSRLDGSTCDLCVRVCVRCSCGLVLIKPSFICCGLRIAVECLDKCGSTCGPSSLQAARFAGRDRKYDSFISFHRSRARARTQPTRVFNANHFGGAPGKT